MRRSRCCSTYFHENRLESLRSGPILRNISFAMKFHPRFPIFSISSSFETETCFSMKFFRCFTKRQARKSGERILKRLICGIQRLLHKQVFDQIRRLACFMYIGWFRTMRFTRLEGVAMGENKLGNRIFFVLQFADLIWKRTGVQNLCLSTSYF